MGARASQTHTAESVSHHITVTKVMLCSSDHNAELTIDLRRMWQLSAWTKRSLSLVYARSLLKACLENVLKETREKLLS